MAIEDFDAVIQFKPDDVPTLVNRGFTFGKMGEFKRAIEDFSSALRASPCNPEAYYQRGSAYSAIGNYRVARSDFNRAIGINPSFANAYLKRGAVHVEENAFKKAVADFGKYISLRPEEAIGYHSRAGAHLNEGKYSRAIEDCTAAIERDSSKNPSTYFLRGFALERVGECEAAIEDLSEAISLNGNNGGYYHMLATVYLRLSKYREALDNLRQAVQLSPDVDAYRETLDDVSEIFSYFQAHRFIQGKELFDEEEFQKALECFNYAVECEEHYAYYDYRGRTLIELGDYHRAVLDFSEAMRLAPIVDADLYCHRGRAYYELRELDEAIKDLDEALRLQPNYAAAYFWRGNVESFRSNYGAAIQDYTQLIKLSPHNAEAYSHRGGAYFMEREYDKVIDDMSEAIKLDSSKAHAYFLRGRAYLFTGKHAEATGDLKNAVRLKPYIKPLVMKLLKKTR